MNSYIQFAAPPQTIHRMLRWLLSLMPVAAFAQGDLAPKPPELKDPVIPRMPSNSAWTVSYKQKSLSVEVPEGAQSPSTLPDSITATITKSGDFYHVSYAQPVAGYREIWSSKGITVAINSTGTRAALVSAVMFPLTDFTRSDFEDFIWVTKSTFKEVRQLKNQRLLMFQSDSKTRQLTNREVHVINQLKQNHQLEQIGKQIESPDGGEFSMKEAKPMSRKAIIRHLGWDKSTEALLDAGTHLPLLMSCGDYQVIVTHISSSAALVPPALVLNRLTQEKERAKAFNSKNSAPRP